MILMSTRHGVGAPALSMWRRPSVPWMIRGIGTRRPTEVGMKVLLTMYGEEGLKRVDSPEDIARTMQAWGEFGAAAQEAGVFVLCDALEGSHTATTVRVRGDRRQVTD